MTFQGRSLDDQPLTAYTTGVVPTDDEPEPLPDPGYTSVPATPSSTADLIAHAHADAAATPPVALAKPGRRFRLPFGLPSFGRGNQAALEAGAPFHAVAPSAELAGSFQAVTPAAALPARPFEPVHAVAPAAALPAQSFQAVAGAAELPRPFEPVHAPAQAPVSGPLHPAQPAAKRGAALPRLRPLPQLQLRDPRVLAGGAIAVGLVLLAISLLGGGGQAPGTGGPNSSQGAGFGVLPSAAVGNASVELTTGQASTFALTGATGAGPAVDSQLNATWTDVAGNSLGIAGMASQGVRTTDASFTLTWTMLIDGAAVTFTSKASECTIGMAVGPTAVHGTFVCKKLRSGDGRHITDFRGTYTT
jgi:hypothetical protein